MFSLVMKRHSLVIKRHCGNSVLQSQGVEFILVNKIYGLGYACDEGSGYLIVGSEERKF